MRFAVLILALAACGDDTSTDLSATFDLAAASIVLPDLSACTPPVFPGFASSDGEHVFDCSLCGCTIDDLTSAATSVRWTRDLVSSELSDSGSGVTVTSSVAPSSATLRGASLYLEGDFDLRVDANVVSGVATMTVSDPSGVSASTSTSANATLRITRSGSTLSGTTETSNARMAVALSAALDECADDAGACGIDATLHALRLTTGTLVDQSP